MSKLNSRIGFAVLMVVLVAAAIFVSVGARGASLRRSANASTGAALASPRGFSTHSKAPTSYSTYFYGRMYQEANDLRDCDSDQAVGGDD